MVPYRSSSCSGSPFHPSPSSSHAGFTLIELLVATGIIAVLMTVVIVAVNPFRMFLAAQQTKRSSDVTTIGKSLDMYLVSMKGVVPTQMYPLNTPKRIAKNSGGPEADLCALLSTQIPGLPIDPTTPGNMVKDCSTSYSTGYHAVANASGKIGVYSPTGISLANVSGLTVVTYGYVPEEFITPAPALLAYTGQWRLDETTSTDTNQFKASGYLDTGKLGQAVSMYGNAGGTGGSQLTYNNGVQISGKNYERWNPNQGTVSFWVKPSWNGNDGLQHFFFSKGVYGGDLQIFKSTGGSLSVYFDNPTPTVIFSANVSSWTSGTWYLVTVRWDVDNVVSGSNYAELYINNSLSSSFTSSWVPRNLYPSFPSFIGLQGYNSGLTLLANSPANALIDDFAIYDRVLSTAEITSLYNAGTGNEAGYVADPSLKFYAKMDGSGTLSPVTYNGGSSASKMTRASSELTGGTNLLANGNLEAATVGAPTSWAVDTGTTASDAETANIFSDTRSQKLTGDGLGNGDGITQMVTVTANTNYLIGAWIKSNGANQIGLATRDQSNAAYIVLPTYTQASTNSNSWYYVTYAFKTPVGCTSLRVSIRPVATANISYYVDNITLIPNLIDNGGMEGTYSGGVAPGWGSGGTGTFASSGTAHSGTYSQSIANGPSGAGLVVQGGTIIVGNSYLASFWAQTNVAGGVVRLTDGNGGANDGMTDIIGTMASANTWYHFTKIWKATSTNLADYLINYTANSTILVDDISVTPLDNIALSLKAWTPVGDSGGSSNSLSVQGSTTGVASNATGIRNSAYTFDGSSGYLRQATIAMNIGSLSYGVNDTTNASFTDDGATMSTYQSSAPYTYMIIVTNSDNTTSWGYMGTASGGNITIFTTKTGATRGWVSIAGAVLPITGSKVPVGYEVRKTDVNILNNVTFGAWIKTAYSAQNQFVISRYDGYQGAGISLTVGGTSNTHKATFATGNQVVTAVSNTSVDDGNWHFIVGKNDGVKNYIYVDGVLENSIGGIVASDTFAPILVGGYLYGITGAVGLKFNGSIDEPFVTDVALTAAQIFDMYNSGR